MRAWSQLIEGHSLSTNNANQDGDRIENENSVAIAYHLASGNTTIGEMSSERNVRQKTKRDDQRVRNFMHSICKLGEYWDLCKLHVDLSRIDAMIEFNWKHRDHRLSNSRLIVVTGVCLKLSERYSRPIGAFVIHATVFDLRSNALHMICKTWVSVIS